MVDLTPLGERLAEVDDRIADAARAASRDLSSITRIVITKFHPASLVRELHALGVRDVGENRHQEAQAKAAELADLDLRWNFVGQLQSKKARQARAYCHAIHSVDRDSLITALSSTQAETPLDAFVQVNLTDDHGRGGVVAADLEAFADRVAAAPGLRLRGIMGVAPLGEDPRPAFASLRALSERVQVQHPDASALSMGMSGDFADAIAEGATHLRIGTAITGNRPDHG
ncbi:YggS family pyridoxal phosphate-dependent enzyme [Salinibacterium sp. SWN1162]|uniref:YggS family pyridoxal phosphate-dependent enzyme n=1 Tax=Salinibacterium sp. SWN1162 TaxID=2792053 RepID=UPI0018CE6318|nr:YggS family pyridoxal phosphate-dependent enzyme [Salinibacterium sp. SWN1162]MBH0009467.1 YggS family pyridoxal phosphate-dependent enzyme [Salinibacterium sp. SWN1162]